MFFSLRRFFCWRLFIRDLFEDEGKEVLNVLHCVLSGRFVSDGSFSVRLYSSRHVLPPLSDAKEGCLCRNRPLEQWRLDYEKEKEVECLLDRLKEHFVTAHPAATQEQREAHKKVNKPHSSAFLIAFSRSCCDRRTCRMPRARFLSNSWKPPPVCNW